ncbi:MULTISPECIES: hypothetical protein [Bradyrhizobium]|uniref:hypothetical protein n=1 Tax=Bradyrhizobium TaxID=374 RepID=UPI0010293EF1|nr:MULTISPECIES: hypothetical protein [Bradyrhizobium]MBO4228207.1 hypothetical protein [Bradyrhizobium neotropicale]RZN28112.1 hypothetical protein CWO90_24015 [Bradyrhizobium sp. Leo121]
MNHSLISADRGTHRKIIALGAAAAVAIMLLAVHGRSSDQTEASRRQPIVQHIAAPDAMRPLALAELR